MQQQMLDDTWPQAVKAAAAWVREAREQSIKVYNTPEGINRRIEAMTATSILGQARGAVAVLRLMRPEDPELEELWRRVNHCPVIMLTGEDYDQPARQLQLVK